ncbi:MAG: DUF2065 domain-containing protein [Pseudomonadota bacterium]
MAAPLYDFLSALALMLVLEGIVFAIFSSRLPNLIEQMRALDPEQARWAGLGMAIVGTAAYLFIRS